MPRRVRAGISLVELLVVISLIAVLLGLLMAGVQMVRQRAREVQVRNDIQQLTVAVQQFKTKHHVSYMPSMIVLREDGAYGTHANATVAALERRSAGDLRRIWPRLQPQVDWNQNGVIDPGDAGSFILEGDQCLVFFLGGAQVNGACVGFSTSPLNPMGTGTREAPSFDFPTNRLQPLAHASTGNSPFLSFIDTYGTQPYLYMASRQGNDYIDPLRPNGDCPSAGVLPYRENLPSVLKYHNRDSFQIVCAGSDRLFGPGGAWDAGTGAPYVNAQPSPPNAAFNGRDDFSNFHGSRLGSGQ
jgi:type II secretory pathway pseudopilin PulG